ncbi:sulfotransferase [Mycobacterium colombiense]|uniref:sulfotransferase family protein n=1 Tax=Mycobacterium colombiense TaxID=339268 RepID=UPI0009B6D4F4|nr:sulfotransferase [Mycobacterium colombiense]
MNDTVRHIGTLVAQLHDDARTATQLSDFGDNDYLEGLQRLVEDFVAIPGIDEDGLAGLAGFLVTSVLTVRLRTEEGWKRHPECLSGDLGAPVFIVGVPRTGTTALHQLLSVDPRFQVSEKWLHSYPKPRPPRDNWADDPDFRQVVAEAEFMPEWLRRTHFVGADEADECLAPMAQSFVSNYFGSIASIPAYDEWMLAQDMTPSLVRYANFLRLIGSSSPGKTWLLKNPSHVLFIDELLDVFPGARVVQTHRDPQAALGSVVSVLSMIGKTVGVERPPRDIARREIAVWSEGVRRIAEARRGRESSFYDVDYREFINRPLAVVRRLYEAFDLELSEQVANAMQRWLDSHPKDQRGAHSYDPDALGVDRHTIEEHFGPYIKEYELQ